MAMNRDNEKLIEFGVLAKIEDKIKIGTWNITFPNGKKVELTEEVEKFRILG